MWKINLSFSRAVVKEIENGIKAYFCSYPIASLKREEYRRMRIVPAHVTKQSFSCSPNVMWFTLRMCLSEFSAAWGKKRNDINSREKDDFFNKCKF